jgi:Tfp pilus assembly protein PilF
MLPDKVEKLCQRATQAIAERDWDKAKQTYLAALGLRSDLPDVHYGLATVYFQLREFTSAAHHFREVTRLDPHRAGAYVNLGAVLNQLAQYDEAVTALRKGIQLDPQRVEAYYNLGLVCKRKGQLDLSISAYKEALRLNPRMADAHLNLGNLFMEKESPRQALTHYEKALEVRTGWDKALDGVEAARDAIAAEEGHQASGDGGVQYGADAAAAAPGGAASSATNQAVVRATSPDADRLVDPVLHATFLAALHQATIISEDAGRLVGTVVGEEIEPVIQELSRALLQSRGSRNELDGCLTKFEAALARMKAAHQALKTSVTKLEEIGDHFPAK